MTEQLVTARRAPAPCGALLVTTRRRAPRQRGRSRGAARRPQPQQSAPTPHQPTAEEEEELHNAYQRASEPEIAPPADPLAVSPELKARIGSDFIVRPALARGAAAITTSMVSVLRGAHAATTGCASLPAAAASSTRAGCPIRRRPATASRSRRTPRGSTGCSTTGGARRSSTCDVVFPAVLARARQRTNYVDRRRPPRPPRGAGRERQLACAALLRGQRARTAATSTRRSCSRRRTGARRAPSRWSVPSSATARGPTSTWASRRSSSTATTAASTATGATYTLIPPLLYYHSAHELDSSSFDASSARSSSQSNAKRDVFDVAPLFFHIAGKPETGGVAEEHTTLFPFFHYGRDPISRSSSCRGTCGA